MDNRLKTASSLIVSLLAMMFINLGCHVPDDPEAEPAPGAAAEQPCDKCKEHQDCPLGGNRADPSKVYSVPAGESPVQGPASAEVTIVESCDFECTYCKKVQGTLQRIRDTYGDSVRLVFKHNPHGFHPQAMPAALAAEAAGKQGKFWEMHDKLFANQAELSDEGYARWAAQLGLDVEQFRADMASQELRERVEADRKLVLSLKAPGTPAFWVNGRFLSGAQPFGRFRELIAEQLIRAGTGNE